MQKGEQAMYDAMAAEFDASAGWSYRLEHGGKHLAMVAVDPDGFEHKIPIPSSARSDTTSQRNFGRQKARRLIVARGSKS